MIVQNRYTAETIHVANWLLLSGNVNLEELIAESHRRTERLRKPDWDDDDYDEHYLAYLIGELESAVDDAIEAAVPDTFCLLREHVWGFTECEEIYRKMDHTQFLSPFITEAFRLVSFEDVADLVLSHLPATTAA